MSKRTKIVGTYRINEDELIQFAVTTPTMGYPDQLAEAKASVLAMLHEELADVMRQTRPAEVEHD